MFFYEHVCRSRGRHRAAARLPTIARNCAACAPNLCREWCRLPMACAGSVCVHVCSSPLKCPFRDPQVQVPQSCCEAGELFKRLHCAGAL